MCAYVPNNVSIDEERKVIEFDLRKPKKITGSRIASIVGLNEYATPFKTACIMAGLYREPDSIYTKAGNVMEPKIRQYLRRNCARYIGDSLGCGSVEVVDPVPAMDCGFEHFPGREPFGGMVDGWVDVDGDHAAVLEIKTANSRDGWFKDGEETVPMSYKFQTSLYCELSQVDEIVFAVGFPEADDYKNPEQWEPNEDNTIVRIVKPLPIKGYMAEAKKWYEKYLLNGVTPPWTEKDERFLDELLSQSVYR